MCDLGGEETVIVDLHSKCSLLREEIAEVLSEGDQPRVTSSKQSSELH